MDLLWMILLVFLVCAEAQNVTEVKVELGQNVTLNCSWNNSDTYWFTEINSQVRGSIGRSFSNDPSGSQYYVYTFRPKYSAFGNSLLITNITAEDCRLYFCGRRINGSIQFVDTFSLVSGLLCLMLSLKRKKSRYKDETVLYENAKSLRIAKKI